MGLQGYIVEKVFEGRRVFDHILLQEDDATSPDGVVSALKGSFLIIHYPGDATDGDIWLNTDGSTSWTQLYDASG